MKISRIFDANASESLNTVTKVLMELQLSDFLRFYVNSWGIPSMLLYKQLGRFF